MLIYWNASISVKGHTLTFQCSCSSQTIQTLAKWKGYNPEPGGKCSYETKVKLAKKCSEPLRIWCLSKKESDEEACFSEAKRPSHPWCGFISFCHCLLEVNWLLIGAFVWYFGLSSLNQFRWIKKLLSHPCALSLSEQCATSRDGQHTLLLAITFPSSLL